MKIRELLREYNEQRLINDFGNKLLAKAKLDTSAPKTDNISELIQQIKSLDPTPNKEFTFWLTLNYANNRINRFEDIPSRAIPNLEKFKSLLRKPNLNPPLPVRDINQIKGLSELEKIVDSYSPKEAISNNQQTNIEEQNFYKTDEAELLYNDNQIKVIMPRTKEASCFFGKGTKWCTAATNNNMFSKYKTGLYIIIIKGTNEKYQFHFESNQFMDNADEPVDVNRLTEKYPVLYKIFHEIAIKNLYLPLIKNPSEEVPARRAADGKWLCTCWTR